MQINFEKKNNQQYDPQGNTKSQKKIKIVYMEKRTIAIFTFSEMCPPATKKNMKMKEHCHFRGRGEGVSFWKLSLEML